MNFDPNLIIFYVDNPLVSAPFYERLLKSQPIKSSSTFVMFLLKSGVRLGLWSKHSVEPPQQYLVVLMNFHYKCKMTI